MKRVNFQILILILFFSFPVLAENFSGFILIENSQPFIVLNSKQQKVLVRALNQDTSDSLKKLQNRDYISGSGTLTASGVMLVESIDFVGLRQLLGVWVGSNTWINFRDFSNVNFYFQNNLQSEKAQLEYTISSGPADTWTIFFADDNSVTVAGLKLESSRAILQYYNSSTGQIVKTIFLTKLPNYR